MTPRKSTNNHRKPTEFRRSEIVDVAMRIIAEQGTKRFTAKLIAKEIGITDAAVFRHFTSKQAIVEAIIERMEAILFEGFPPTDDDPIERLGTFFRRRVLAIQNHPHLSRLLLSDHLAHAAGPGSMARIVEFKERSQRFVRGCLEEAKRRGMLADGVGQREMTILVLGAVLALSHSGETTRQAAQLNGLSSRVWSLLEQIARGGKKPTARRQAKTPSAVKARQRPQESTKHSVKRRAR